MFKGERGEEAKRKKMTPPGRSPRSAAAAIHVNTVESERIFRQKDATELADLHNQLARMRTDYDN